MNTIKFAAIASALVAASVPAMASASVQSISLTSGATASGNQLSYTGANGLAFTVTGMQIVGGNIAAAATAPLVFAEGLGLEPAGDDRHTIDNSNGADFLVFRFNQAVALTGATFANANWYRDLVADTDATISFATSNQAYDTALNSTTLTSLITGLVNPINANAFASDTTTIGTSTRSFNSANATGNLWLVGASVFAPDANIDSFKLRSINVNVAAVPEPATWAMLIAGFGFVGGAMRRRPRRTVAFA